MLASPGRRTSRLFFTTEDRGRQSITSAVTGGGVSRRRGDSHLDDMQFSPDGKTKIYTEQPLRLGRSIFQGFLGSCRIGGRAHAAERSTDRQRQLTPPRSCEARTAQEFKPR